MTLVPQEGQMPLRPSAAAELMCLTLPCRRLPTRMATGPLSSSRSLRGLRLAAKRSGGVAGSP
eukprot:2399000-Pyramimonas_sp.AAC.1